MKNFYFFLTLLSIFLYSCNSSRCLYSPFDNFDASKSEIFSNLEGDFELLEVLKDNKAGKKIADLQLEIITKPDNKKQLAINMITFEDEQEVALPPLKAYGESINGQDYLAFCLDLQKLAELAGFNDPSNLAVPVYCFIKLNKKQENMFLMQSINFAKLENKKWIPLDDKLLVDQEGLVSSDKEKIREILEKEKTVSAWTLFLKKK